MTKKANILKSLESVSILCDRITDEESYRDIMPFITFVLDGSLRRKVSKHPYHDELNELIDGAIAYSDDVNAFTYAIDELYNAVVCL